MRTRSSHEEGLGAGQETRAQATPEAKGQAAGSLTRLCCGKLIEPRLAEIRDGFGQSLFAAVWHCPCCGRVTC